MLGVQVYWNPVLSLQLFCKLRAILKFKVRLHKTVGDVRGSFWALYLTPLIPVSILFLPRGLWLCSVS